jgi:hypothetical protein
VIGNSSGHRRGALGPHTVLILDRERLVDPREVVIHVVQRNGVRKAPFPMSEVAWTQMIAVLNAMKPGLVAPSDD